MSHREMFSYIFLFREISLFLQYLIRLIELTLLCWLESNLIVEPFFTLVKVPAAYKRYNCNKYSPEDLFFHDFIILLSGESVNYIFFIFSKFICLQCRNKSGKVGTT